MRLCLLLFCVFAAVVAVEKDCSFSCYDDSVVEIKSGSHTFEVNLCHGVGAEKDRVIQQSGFGDNPPISCGSRKHLRVQKKDQFSLTLFTVADPTNSEESCPCIRRSVIEVECALSTALIEVTEDPLCMYHVKLRSPVACPK